ncbi:MAG TPA: VOC family protein [Xanthobacteraceae bacterium]|nr:VOC family protein [Xanthobacteraceae bacterium]
MARGLDHAVHAVRDLDAAADLYARLGFHVGPRNIHPWGTHNRIIQFPGFFLELLTVAQPDKLGADGFSTHFGAFNRDFLARDEGLSMLILESEDVEHDVAAFRADGIAASDVLNFERQGRLADGSEATLGFSLGFARDPTPARAGFAVCRQRQPDLFWSEALQQHPNTADGVASVIMVADNPTDHHIFLSAFAGERELHATSLGVSVATPRGDIQILDPAAFRSQFGIEAPDIGEGLRLAAVRFTVRNGEALVAALEAGEVDFLSQMALTVVPAAQALGATLVFSPA